MQEILYILRVREDTDKCMSKSIEFEQISDCSASTTTLAPIQSTVPKRKCVHIFLGFIYIYNLELRRIKNIIIIFYIRFQFHPIKGFAIFVGKRNLQCSTAENKVKRGDKQLLTKLPFKQLQVCQQYIEYYHQCI